MYREQRRHVRTAFMTLLVALVTWIPGWVQAEVDRVVINETSSLDSAGARKFLRVSAQMEGRVTRGGGETGHYRVPVVLVYPDRDSNGVGFVDIVNSAAFLLYEEGKTPWGKRFPFNIGDAILGPYLKQEGYTYIAVDWSRMVTEELGPSYGVIENGRDGYEIVRDAARFLRNVSKLEGSPPFRPKNSTKVIAFGKSQTGFLERQMLLTGEYRGANGAPVYDGFLVGVAGNLCYVLNNDATPRPGPGPTIPTFGAFGPCGGAMPNDVKVIAIDTESDMMVLGGHLSRGESPSYRKYELAGIPHIPGDEVDLRGVGAAKQIQEGFRPVYKAALRNLVAWITQGTPPPPSRYMDVKLAEDGQVSIARDADGNAIGGLRLPHMHSLVNGGKSAGAPLGKYTGLDPAHTNPMNVILWMGGTFEPFPESELKTRYPSPERYVELVSGASDALLAERYILNEDRDAYAGAARSWHAGMANR